MSRPIHAFESLRDAYLRYFDSAFDLRFEEVVQARRRLLDRDGVLYREPIVEPQPAYAGSGHDVRSAVSDVLGGAEEWPAAVADDLAGIAEAGLFPSASGDPIELYAHQAEMLRASTRHGRDAVILTGTGSGKTEAIYLPVLAALAKESTAWQELGPAPRNDWWAMDPPPGSRRRIHHPRIPQRQHEQGGRRPGVRALVLYPLNALAEDQMARLRLAMDGDKARRWFSAKRPGNRFWFGRYTGWTPLAKRPDDTGAQTELREELKRLSAMASSVSGTPAERFFPRLDGGEMWSRWDMQGAPPDILITNYSMLNIMLMRDAEASIFDLTAEWLRSSGEHVFHLVVDELHTYRGTPGTEVGYILRALYERLGLHPNHPQLRILASSASLGDDEAAAQDYLRQFFGRSGGFALIRGAGVRISLGAGARLSGLAHPLARFGEAAAEEGGRSLHAAVNAVAEAAGVPLPEDEQAPELRISAVLEEAGAAEAVRAACNGGTDESPASEPLSLQKLAEKLFPGTPPEDAAAGTRGLVTALSAAPGDSGGPLLPMRVHLFFRNVQGMWACSSSECSEASWREPRIPIGRLYDRPTMTCGCGSRVLEMLYCEPCGEIFLGGYRRELETNAWLLVPDDPNIEKAPDHSASGRTYGSYAVYWPARQAGGRLREPQRRRWRQEKVERRWTKAEFDHRTGEIRVARQTGGASGWLYHIPDLHRAAIPARAQAPSIRNERPAVCPHCDADWSSMRNAAPIRAQRTGFQRTAQVLADALLREIAPPEGNADRTGEDARRKLVLFSDSRQDAAKLSIGVAKSHWLDALRQALAEGMADDTRAVLAFQKKAQREALPADEERLAEQFLGSRQQDALAITATQQEGMREMQSPEGGMTMQELADQVVARAKAGLSKATDLEAEAERRLLAAGMNPGGVDRSVTWTDLNENRGDWKDLFDWRRTPAGDKEGLSADQQEHRRRITRAAREEVAGMLFAGGRRDLESLMLGCVTFDRTDEPRVPHTVQEAADSTIRLLGKRRRIDTHRATADDARLPGYVCNYLEAVATANGLAADDLEQEVTDLLQRTGAFGQGLLRFQGLFVARPSETRYECGVCSRLHVHRSGGICSECHAALHEPRSGGGGSRRDEDYYRWLATKAGPIFRLNCAELTGQTDKQDARNRQRLFQNVTVDGEEAITDNIDLLSVTTTMEAGVDIGALLAVMMANMPPMRFNYQQRVGRAGRRKAPLSLAVTLCRGRSHDDYYFQRPERITADPPPPPYVDTARPQILHRVLAKEVLRRAFAELGLFSSRTGDSVHGEFGTPASWNGPPESPPPGYQGQTVSEIIQEWIGRHHSEVEEICDSLMIGTRLEGNVGERTQAISWIARDLIPEVTRATQDPGLVQDKLSERLANQGILPMFGFPTRARLLYHQRPGRWPPQHVVDRDLELAVSMFAPGAETVKERTIHTAIGVGHYQPRGQDAVEGEDPLGPSVQIGLCRNCQHVETDAPSSAACPVCGAQTGSGERSFQAMDLRQPKGFISYFSRARDYDGAFEFVPRAGRPKAGQPAFRLSSQLNFEIGSGVGRLHVVNDNGGRLFSFSQERWAGSEAMIDVDAANAADRRHAASTRGRVPETRHPAGPTTSCALAAISDTDMMILGIQEYGCGRQADPRTPQGRGALYSLAFMLRRAAAVYLDIQDYELKAGIRSRGETSRHAVTGQVFLCDTLENGAGYSTHLGKPGVAQELLEMISKPTSRGFHERLVAHEHADACSASCPDCLRSYSNLAYHNLLDWRLAVDMAELALDAGATVSLGTARWKGIAETAAKTLEAARPNSMRIDLAGLPALADGNQALIVTHPLWQAEQSACVPELEAAWDKAEQELGLEVVPGESFISVFEALRRPA